MRLKEKHSMALITVSHLYVLFDMSREEGAENGDPYKAQCAKEEHGDPGEEEGNMLGMVYVSEEDMRQT